MDYKTNYFFSGTASFLSLSASGFFASSAAAVCSPSFGVSPSAPSAASVVSSAGFSGSLTIVGAATVAITKSLPVIVGMTFSGSLIAEILILAPISKPSRSTTNSLGIPSVGHFSSTFLLTIF